MIRKKKMILNVFKDKKASFLDTSTLLRALEKRGIKMTKRELSNFIRNSLEYRYLISFRDPKGTIIGWELVNSV